MEYDTSLHQVAQLRRGVALSETYQTYYQPWIVFALLLVSWWTSFVGVVSMSDWITGASEETVSVAILVTAAAMSAQFALWHITMRLIPYYGTTVARSIGVFVMLVLLILLGLSSTFTSFAGLIQDSSRGLEAQSLADRYAAKVEQLEARASVTQDALLAMRPQMMAACQRYEQELNTGAITGSRGRGLVTGHLLALCTSKQEIVAALEETVRANSARVTEINTISQTLDRILFDREAPIGTRELQLLQATRRIDILLRELKNSDRSRGLRAAVEALSNSIGEMEVVAGDLAENQAQAISSLITEERSNASAVLSLISVIEAIPLPEAGRARMSPSQELVLKHWARHLPQLALALACDLFAPLSALLFWAANMRGRRRNKLDINNGSTL